MVPGYRVPNESYMLVANELEKSVRIKPWKIAFTWFPFPVKEPQIRPTIADTILVLFHVDTDGSINYIKDLFGYGPIFHWCSHMASHKLFFDQ